MKAKVTCRNFVPVMIAGFLLIIMSILTPVEAAGENSPNFKLQQQADQILLLEAQVLALETEQAALQEEVTGVQTDLSDVVEDIPPVPGSSVFLDGVEPSNCNFLSPLNPNLLYRIGGFQMGGGAVNLVDNSTGFPVLVETLALFATQIEATNFLLQEFIGFGWAFSDVTDWWNGGSDPATAYNCVNDLY